MRVKRTKHSVLFGYAGIPFYLKRKIMYIKTEGYIEKASKLSEGEVDVVVSTSDWDAQGERILAEGVDFKSYLKGNNVILWAHDGFNLPIGNATKMWVEGKKVMARAKFYLKDDFPRKVYQYVVDGIVKAVSIGGMVDEWAEDGLTIKKLTMKEFSFVSVPANENALVASKSLSDKEQSAFQGLARNYARKCLVKSEDEVKRNIEVLENLVATLKEVAVSEPQEASASNIRVVLRQAQAVDHQAEQLIRSIKLKGQANE